MKTIRPLELEALLEADKPVEIIDIRPLEEFERVHIDGAHSLPSAQLSVETLLCSRELLPSEPLYLVSESGALAQLTACDLDRQGLDNVVIVSGGMHVWLRDSLPVVRHRTISDRLDQRSKESARSASAVSCLP